MDDTTKAGQMHRGSAIRWPTPVRKPLRYYRYIHYNIPLHLLRVGRAVTSGRASSVSYQKRRRVCSLARNALAAAPLCFVTDAEIPRTAGRG